MDVRPGLGRQARRERVAPSVDVPRNHSGPFASAVVHENIRAVGCRWIGHRRVPNSLAAIDRPPSSAGPGPAPIPNKCPNTPCHVLPDLPDAVDGLPLRVPRASTLLRSYKGCQAPWPWGPLAPSPPRAHSRIRSPLDHGSTIGAGRASTSQGEGTARSRRSVPNPRELRMHRHPSLGRDSRALWGLNLRGGHDDCASRRWRSARSAHRDHRARRISIGAKRRLLSGSVSGWFVGSKVGRLSTLDQSLTGLRREGPKRAILCPASRTRSQIGVRIIPPCAGNASP